VYQRFFCSRQAPIQVDADSYEGDPVRIGDEVVIGVDEKTFLLGSLIVYLLPLLALVFFAIGSTLLLKAMQFYHELLVIAISLVGVIFVYRASRNWLARRPRLPMHSAKLLRRAD
jgi:positive regulator of sigma E activity